MPRYHHHHKIQFYEQHITFWCVLYYSESPTDAELNEPPLFFKKGRGRNSIGHV